MKIYLASKSPRRKELLEQMQVEFEVLAVETPEVVQPNETPEMYSKRVTDEKLKAAWNKIIHGKYEPRPILCADTEVVLDNQILGKPSDQQEAFEMLKSYSGRIHEVITSVGLIFHGYQQIKMNKTFVTFSKIPYEAINYYLTTGNYKDKSGGYGIQSYIGQFISHIEGCFYSVMGLPLNTVRVLLNDLQAHLSDKNISKTVK